MLGEAGAIVYCTGRSVRGKPPSEGIHAGRTETIEETAEMVSARGGVGIAVRVDHTDESQVERLFERVREEQGGRLDVLVNVLGGDTAAEWKPFWQLSLEKGLRWMRQEVFSHIITSRHAAALMVEGKRRGGLIVEITDGDGIGYRGNLFYDLVKLSTIRLAYAMAEELYTRGIAAVALTPGFMRTEWMLDRFGVTEANWRDAVNKPEAKRFGFEASETPCFTGRAVAALAADPHVLKKSGGVYASCALAEEYGFTDIDGSRPNWKRYFAENFNAMLDAPTKTGFEWALTRREKGKGKR
jgi:NAD(P)-dependent dehydrogenase (short-subunit alcohol dehydrogenase family)